MKRKRKAKIVATLGPASATRGAPAPLVGYRIHTSPIRNAFHGVARRAGSRATPRCEGWPRRREIECPRPALSSALTSCAFVSFVVKALSQRTTPSYTNQYAFRRSDAASNHDFEPGFEGPSGVRSLDLHVLRVPPPVSPRYGELSPCYGDFISLLLSCSACTAKFPQAVVIKINFPAKTGPETANSPRFPPVIREYQGEWSPGDHKGEENASNRASFGGVSASLRSRRSSRSKSPANRARRMGGARGHERARPASG